MKTQVIEKTIGNAPKTKNYYSSDGESSIMASVVEVEMYGRVAPHQIAVWMENNGTPCRVEFGLDQAERFALELLKMVQAAKVQEIETRPEVRGNL